MAISAQCPSCENGDTTFKAAKHTGGGIFVRKRTCLKCGHKFESTELPTSSKRALELMEKAKHLSELVLTQEEQIANLRRHLSSEINHRAVKDDLALCDTVIKGLSLTPEVKKWAVKAMEMEGVSTFLQSIINDAYFEDN